MKNFIKGRWFPLIVAILIVAIVAFVMALFGWRITYVPGLENSWEAISAVAAWAGAIGTVAAVFSAIYVANRQNRIALFEKRYKVYNEICNCGTFSYALKLANSKEDISMIFLTTFEGKSLINDLTLNENSVERMRLHCNAVIRSRELLVTLKESKFLFTQAPWFFQYIESMAEKLMLLLTPLSMDDTDLSKQKAEFVSMIHSETYNKVLRQMEKELQLNSKR